MSGSDDSWQIKWEFIIDRIKKIVSMQGKELKLINIEADIDPQRQFEKYQETCESVKSIYEVVVTTGLPGEERIFWPSQDVQFYIRMDDEKIHSTGNARVINQIMSFNEDYEQPSRKDSPDLEFWKNEKMVFQLDNYRYVDEENLLKGAGKVNLPELLKKYPYQQTREFENKEYWYLLKFFFIASHLEPLGGSFQLLAGIPRGIKIKCSCGILLKEAWHLKGFFEYPEFNYKHQYYLRISEKCEECGSTICIYRDKALDSQYFCGPVRIFINFVDPSWKHNIEDLDMVGAWHSIFKQAVLTDMQKIERLYSDDIIKFGNFIQRMDRKYNK